MNKYDMIAFIVLVVMIATVARAWITTRGSRTDRNGAAEPDAEDARLRGEVQQLRDRIAVLERITVDKEHSLAREIEGLREH